MTLKCEVAKSDAKPYKLTDNAGLHLLVYTKVFKYWRLRSRHLDKEKTLVLGLYPDTSLSEARLKRDELRKQIAKGINPCEHDPILTGAHNPSKPMSENTVKNLKFR